MSNRSPRGPYKMPKTPSELFWEKVDKSGDCWRWLGAKKGGRNNAYGSFMTGGRIHRKQWYAHRYSYFLANGHLPDKCLILHSCDIPDCVNPAHLTAGTQTQNMQQASKRNRLKPYNRAGEKNHRATLTEAQVVQIKSLIASGITMISIAEKFQTKYGRIADIKSGRAWAHI